MKLVAAVAWYDEPATFIARLLTSLRDVVDEVVELPGRWELMPGVGPAAWRSQVEKRDALMRRASERGDWILVIDGDEYVEAFDVESVRAALEQSPVDVASVTLRNLNRPWPLRELAPQWFDARRLFRSGTTVPGPEHYRYERDGRRLDNAPALDLCSLVTVAHDNRNRPARREQAAQDYRRARRAAGVEVACR